MRLFLSFSLLFFMSNFTSSYALNNEALSPFEVAPQALVANAVDATSGTYFEQEEDFVLSSIEELAISRHYSSEWAEWRFFPQCLLVKEKNIISTFDSNGTPLRLFLTSPKSSEYQFKLKTPIQNLARGPLTGKSHFSDCKGSLQQENFQLTLPNGSLRVYQKISSSKRHLGPLCSTSHNAQIKDATFFRLISEHLASHNTRLYHYDKEGLLESIELVDKKEKSYAKIHFQYGKGAKKIQVIANDKKMVSYHFEDGLLTTVSRDKKPNITYKYKKIHGKPRLVKKELPEGRYIHCTYKENGKVATFLSSASPTPLYLFQYEKDKTDVRDSNNHLTTFHYSHRLLSSIEFHETTTLARKDTFIWNLPDESGVQTLRGYTLQEANGNTLQAIRYEYQKNKDTRIIHQDIYKAATTANSPTIKLDADGLPTAANDQKHRLSSYFSVEHPWQLRYREDELGNRTTYQYRSTSNLLEKKFVHAQVEVTLKAKAEVEPKKERKIIHREFFTYNDAGQLTQTIVDDGGSDSVKELAGATFRSSTRIKPRTFRSNDKETTEEWRYDPQTEKDYLIRSFCNTFDKDGNLIKCELYNLKGEKAKVEEFAFDSHGNRTRQVNALKETTDYSYDKNDNCIQIKVPGLVTDFIYDKANRLAVTKRSYSDGKSVTTRGVFDAAGNQIATIDRYGNQTDYTYDSFSRCTSILYPFINSNVRPKESFRYDLLGNCTSKTNPKGYQQSFRYNVDGQLLSICSEDGTAEHLSYNNQGQIKNKSNKNGTSTNFCYDTKNHLKSIETNLLAQDSKIINCLSSSHFAYNKNHCTEVKQSDGTTISKTYDKYGCLSSETEQSSKANTEYFYDSLHRPIRIKRAINDTESLTECYKYDALDRITAKWIKEPDGSKTAYTTFTYDSFGNIATTTSGVATEEIKYIEGTLPHLITNVYGGTTRIEYKEPTNALEQRHLQMIVTDPKGVITIIECDALGRKIEEITKDPLGVIISHQKMSYDLTGNIITTEVALLPQKDSLYFEWGYGPMSRLEVIKDMGRCTTQHSFDTASGRLLKTNRYNDALFYGYSKEGQLQKLYKDNQEIATFAYDSAGRVVQGSLEAKVTTKREYSPQGLITSEIITDKYGDYKVDYTYDRLGRMIKVSLPDKSYIKYDYRGSKLQAVLRKTKEGEETYRHEYTKYNEHGLPIEEKLLNGETRKRAYALSGGITSLETKNFSESIIERDVLGNPTKIETNKKPTLYSYDCLNRLVEEKGIQTQSYSYDSLNNLLSHNETKSSYNKRNHLLKTETQSYSYDAADNVAEITPAKGSRAQLGYNVNNQLKSYKVGSQAEVNYGWDIYGRRTLREENNSIRRMFFIGNSEIGAINSSGAIVELKIPEKIVDGQAQGAIAIELRGRPYLPTCDLLGNIVSLYSLRSQRVSESYEYTAFGKERTLDEEGKECTPSNPWRYRGQRTDATTHFVCFGFRDYDPATQRFITRDPLGVAEGFNQYAYTLNNPIAYADAYGLKARYGPCTCYGYTQIN